MRNGKVVPVVKTGSYANIASTQIKNTLDGAVWGQINQNLKIGWQESNPRLGLECCTGQPNVSHLCPTPFEVGPQAADVCLDGL